MPRKKPVFVRLPNNPTISSAIIRRNRDRIVGASFNIGRRYQLQPEDREELISHVHLKIARVDWRSKFKEDLWWVVSHYPNHPATWLPEEIAKIMNGYCYTLIRKSMLDEVRRIKCGGLSGLGLHPLDSIQPHDAYGFDDYRANSEDFTPTLEPSADGQADRTAARQVVEIARAMLSTEEWIVVALTFGFDGGDSRTPTQVAREARMPRKVAQELIESAIRKMRVRVDDEHNLDNREPGHQRNDGEAVPEARLPNGQPIKI